MAETYEFLHFRTKQQFDESNAKWLCYSEKMKLIKIEIDSLHSEMVNEYVRLHYLSRDINNGNEKNLSIDTNYIYDLTKDLMKRYSKKCVEEKEIVNLHNKYLNNTKILLKRRDALAFLVVNNKLHDKDTYRELMSITDISDDASQSEKEKLLERLIKFLRNEAAELPIQIMDYVQQVEQGIKQSKPLS